MVLGSNELNYFNTQVALSAASFGVAAADVTAVGMALNAAFNNRCGRPVTVVPSAGPVLQSVCSSSLLLPPSHSVSCLRDLTPLFDDPHRH